MKIAVGISGIYRPKVGPVKQNIEQIQKKFNADMYYHTWDSRENDVPEEYRFATGNSFFTSPEPTMTYHPVFDPEPTLNRKHTWYRKTKDKATKTLHGNKQILGYCNLYDKIPKNYDLYVRTRWDVMINPHFDFAAWFDRVINEGTVGFMIRDSGANYFPFRGKKGKMVAKDSSNINNNDWYQMLADNLIIHTSEQLDTSYIYQLHEDKQLLGCEWGWWQTFSKPHGGLNHTSVYGGVRLLR